jgi:hypothetical protein
MTFEVSAAPAPAGEVPAAWRGAIQSHLHPQENVCACLEVDLDERLHFVPSVVLATYERIISLSKGVEAQDWPYLADLTLGLMEEANRNGAVLGANYPGDRWYTAAYALLTSKGLRPLQEPKNPTKGVGNKLTTAG